MQSDIARVREQAAKMRRIVAAGRDLAATPVARSSWSVAEHFDHTIKVAHSVLSELAHPRRPPPSRPLNLIGKVILVIGWIPRGRGRSPEKLRGGAVTMDELRERLTALEAVIEEVAGKTVPRSRVPLIPHPYFGGLTYAQALRFVAIHNHHHLKIVAPSVQ
jgi:hypothetical protein